MLSSLKVFDLVTFPDDTIISKRRKTPSSSHLASVFLVLAFFAMPQTVTGYISCYTCSSVNGTDVFCEDPMSPAFKKLETNCMVPKENHVGTFPANFCIKMIGTSVETKRTLVVRTCVLEDMNSQCGTFKFQNDTLKGCLLTCNYDGCNTAMGKSPAGMLLAAMVAIATIAGHFFGKE